MSLLPDPVQPPTMEARIQNALTDVRDRLASIRKNRPRTSANTSAPSGATTDGTRHMDTDDRRFYVHNDGEWLSADSERWVVTDAGTVSTTGGRWQNLGGTPLAFSIAAPAMIMVYVDAEVNGNAYACGVGTCLTRAEVGLTDTRYGVTQRVIKSLQYNVWEHRVSTGFQDSASGSGLSDSDGAVFPRGGFTMVWLETPGSYSFSLLYAAVDETPGGGQPTSLIQFRNRTIYALAL